MKLEKIRQARLTQEGERAGGFITGASAGLRGLGDYWDAAGRFDGETDIAR